MQKLTPQQRMKKRIIKVLLVVVILLVIYIIYTTGRMNGLILGVAAAQEKNNQTVCDFLKLERDVDGYCILNRPAKYEQYVDCGWEKFKVEGKEKQPPLVRFIGLVRRIVYYPILTC